MPQPTAVLQVEGVLRKSVTGAPLDSGKRLYHALAASYHLVLVTEETDRERARGWLAMEGLIEHGHVVYIDDPAIHWPQMASVLRNSYGYDVEYLVVTDPAEAVDLIGHGYNTLLVTNAAYALPEWRPDASRGIKPWSDLNAEIERQRLLRAADTRMEGTEF